MLLWFVKNKFGHAFRVKDGADKRSGGMVEWSPSKAKISEPLSILYGHWSFCQSALAGPKMPSKMLLLPFLVVAVAAADPDESLFALPDDLLIGAGMAAVQSEGAWNESGE